MPNSEREYTQVQDSIGEPDIETISEEQIGIEDQNIYQTNEVAEMLNIDVQKLRNICNSFDEFLSPIEKSPGGHRKFKKKNIHEIEFILQELNTGTTVNKLIRKFREQKDAASGIIDYEPNKFSDGDKKALELVKYLEKSFSEMVDKSIDKINAAYAKRELEYEKALEDKALVIDELRDNIKELKEQIEFLTDQVRQNQTTKRKTFLGLFKRE